MAPGLSGGHALTYRPSRKKWGLRARRRVIHAAVLLGVGGIVILIAGLVQPFYTFNLWFSDQFRETGRPSANIVIAGIDDESLSVYGKWSEWSRDLHAQAVRNLTAAGAAAIGYDVVFADASPHDEQFAAALAGAGDVVLAVAGSGRTRSADKTVTLSQFLTPTPALEQPAALTGHVNIVPDPDGKVRRVPLIVRGTGGQTYPELGLAVLFTLFHKEPPAAYARTGHDVDLLSRVIPVDASFSMRLNYAAAEKPVTYISYSNIISGDFDASLVRNKIILVGMTATGDLDTWSIPASAVRVPGVLIHAAAIDTILRTAFLTEAGMNVTLLIMLALTLAAAGLLSFFGTWRGTDVLKATAFAGGLLIAYVLICSLAAGRGYILNVLYPVLTIGVIYIGNTVYMVITEQNDKKFVKELFGRYVSPQVSHAIIDMANSGNLVMGGEEKEVTIFFTDIRSFTTLSEKMSPAEVVKMLNIALPIMINAITQHGGLVNKFAGDSLMGVWNAPQPEEAHAYLAVKAAWDAQQEIKAAASREPLLKGVYFGVGINTGNAIAGNVGSVGRSEYTVIGDAVNLASRICSVAPGGEILIGPATYELVKDKLAAEPQPAQMFKGKSQPIVTYRVTGLQ
jgi:adenylate cyclase